MTFECKHPVVPFTVAWSNFQLFSERSAFTTGFTFVHISTPWFRVRDLLETTLTTEPQLNREEILAALTDFVFGRTHSLTGTSSSGSHCSDSLVDSDTRPGDWCECGNCEPSSEMRRAECLCCADAVLLVHQYTRVMTGEPEGSTVQMRN